MRRFCVMPLVVAASFGVLMTPSMRAAQPGPVEQQAANAQAPPVPWTTFTEAMIIKDVDKKIDALRKVVQDYPGTPAAEQAKYQLLALEVGRARDANKRALEQVKLFLADSEPDTGIGKVVRVANMLLNQGVMLDEAEGIVRSALHQLDEKRYVAGLRQQLTRQEAEARAQDPQAKPPGVTDDATLSATYARDRQGALVALGRICVKRGKTAEGEKILREACLLDPGTYSATTAALQLAELAKSAGRDQDRLDYLAIVALGGRLTPETRSDLEALYKKTHAGSLDGLEEMLDARYETQTPRTPVERYVPGASRSGRVVLAEVFSGAGCVPCVSTDRAVDAVLERYTNRELALLVYHVDIPLPDPMANLSTLARQKFYELQGVPNAFIDGAWDDPDPWGMASVRSVYAGLQRSIERGLSVKPDVALGLQAAARGSLVNVKVNIGRPSTTVKNLRLQIALAESRVRYSGQNGVRYHAMVVRSLAGDGGRGLPLAPGRGNMVSFTFDLSAVVAQARVHLDTLEAGNEEFGPFKFLVRKHEIGAGPLVVVGFAQDDDTKQVLQAASVIVPLS